MKIGIKECAVILGVHYHLPIGTPYEEFKKIYSTRIMPFFQILYNYSQFPVVVHFSGNTFEHIEKQRDGFFMLLNDMVKRKQLELCGGGFYEPAMTLLQTPDRVAQIELLTTYIRKCFGKRVNGCWIPNAAWEQSVAQAIARAGLSYSFVDESRFITAGLSANDYALPCVCEDKGKLIKVFPVYSSLNKPLRQGDVEDVFDKLIKTKGHFVRSIFPDFFNFDPAVVTSFFETLLRYEEKIDFLLPGAQHREDEPATRVYFSDTLQKQCMIEHPEATIVYGKMMRIKSLLTHLKIDKANKESAKEELLKIQDYSFFCYADDECRVPGIFNTPLRHAVWSALLEAERAIRIEPCVGTLITLDIDFDGALEYIFQSEKIDFIVRAKGASLLELDCIPARWNYHCALTLPMLPEQESEAGFFDTISPVDGGAAGSNRVLGNEIWKKTFIDRARKQAGFQCGTCDGPFGALLFVKDYMFVNSAANKNEPTIAVHYKITNTGTSPLEWAHSFPLNFSFFSDNPKYLKIFAAAEKDKKQNLDSGGAEIKAVQSVCFKDLHKKLTLTVSCDENFDAKIERVSASYLGAAGDIIDAYQWTRLIIRREQSLAAGDSAEFVFKLNIS